MTAADKFGIALAIGVTIVFIAIAASFASMGTMTQTVVSVPVSAPAPVPAPAPAPVPTPVPAPAEETPAPAEETPAPAEETPAPAEETPAPAEETPAPAEETPSAPSTADVSISKGSSSPGCETNNECFVPNTVTVSVGGTVTWTNNDAAAHTVTSGTPSNGPDGTFDSSIFMSKKTFEHTFDKAGTYDYFCVVHPWMTGKVTVE